MSSRQLRKLRMQQQQQHQPLQEDSRQPQQSCDDNDSSDNDVLSLSPHSKVTQASLFAALGGQGEDDEDDDDENNFNDETETQIEANTNTGTVSKANKKKKKKNKKNKKSNIVDLGDDEASTAKRTAEPSDDEIDRALKALGVSSPQHTNNHGPTVKSASQSATPLQQDGDSGSSPTLIALRRMNKLLGINPYHLRPANELKHMFGRDIITSASALEEAEGDAARRARRGGLLRHQQPQQVDIETYLRVSPGEARLSEMVAKRNVFVLGREHWPRGVATGLGMKTVAAREGEDEVEYAFTYDIEYEGTQAGFFHCVMLGDPMRLIHLAKEAREWF